MEETYQLIEGSPSLRDLDVENGFLWCPFGHSGRQNEPGILISRLDDGSYDVRLGTGFDSPERFAAGDPDWSWMDIAVDSTVDVTFADDIALNDWIASETTATGAAWARCFNRYCGPQPPDKTHVYTLTVYALDCKLGLSEGYYLNEFRRAIEGHVLAKSVVELPSRA